MKPTALRVLALVFTLALAAAQPAGAQEAKHPSEPAVTHVQTASPPLFMELKDVKWERLTGPNGECPTDLAVLRVDPKTQATYILIRNPAGCYVPRHWHTANETITGISGTFIMECEGEVGEVSSGSFASTTCWYWVSTWRV